MNQDWNTRQTLLMRAKDPNDQAAWEEFIHFYKDFLRVIIYKITGSHKHSEDLLQTVLFEIWRSLARFQTDQKRAKFRTWLSAVVRNTVIDQLKKENRQEKIQRELDPQPPITQPELEKEIQREWEIHLSRLALNNISERFSGKAMQVFEMSLAGKTNDEICSTLEISVDSAYTLKNRVKKSLIREIKNLRNELEL